MWKVLLVEDELFVRESIKMTVKWEEHGFTVAGEANDGEEALQMLKSMPYDLVITDIKMPIMDGVELLKQARALDMKCKFVMLSCLNEFEYVRQALEYGASNYILKLSMSISSLVDSLSKIKGELEQQSQYADQKVNLFYGQIWRRITEPEQDEQEHDEQAEKEKPPAAIAGLRELTLTLATVIRGGERWAAGDHKRVLSFLDFRFAEAVHQYHGYGLTTVFVWHRPGSQPVDEAAAPSAGYAIVYATDVPYSQLEAQWRRIIQQSWLAWYEGAAGALSADRIEPRESAPYFSWRKKRELVSSFEKLDEQKCDALIDEIWREMQRSCLSPVHVKKIAADIDYTLYSMIQKGGSHPSAIHDARTHEELKQAIRSRLRHYLDQYQQTRPAILTDHPEVNKVIAYINDRYDTDISVKSMAAMIAMDENYFSTLFKAKTKESLIAYVHRVRMDKAMFYLTQTDLTINQISEQIGYRNINYFNRVFKRITGATPSQYRE
ncbi:response regulator [Cohnella hashimotonis]|uniref:Response regulator n=1 Tax=Cohnella hashimotonis TaxID=2826895 RepID=A0ABT6TAG5_9BACL|nr:response regulator [Cohnella hashimotonis]MDI4643821.1 response regulator [Cohnella hashimotonis]